MTTRTSPSPIEILADAALRGAVEAGAAVIAFDEGLNAVLFADAAGLALLEPAGASPALRQIRSAAQSLARSGRATVFLRRSTRAGSSTVRAELTLRSGSGPAFVLAAVDGLGGSMEAADLVEAAGLGRAAAAVFVDGAERFATPDFAGPSPKDLADRIARFEVGAEPVAVEEDGALKLTLLRSPFGGILVVAETVERPPCEEPAPSASDRPAPPAPAPAGFASFSVKRAKIGEPRPGMSVGALLKRWHSRGPEAPVAGATIEKAEGIDLPSPPVAPAEPVVETPPAAKTGPARAAALRSNWGPTPPATDATAPSNAVRPVADEGAGATASQAATESDGLPDVAEAPIPGASDLDPATETEANRLSAEDAAEPSGAEALVGPDPAVAEPEDAASTTQADDASGAEASEPMPVVDETPAGPAFVPRFDVPPVRFVWQIDRNGAFRFLSPDFAGAVGPNAADVVGRDFITVARVFGFDETREIARLLERRDTWSGRTILWPVEGSDRKVPVDLAALPVYGRDRSFDGFRGFGIVRLNESVADAERLGLLLTSGTPPARATAFEAAEGGARSSEADADAPRAKPFLRRFEAESFGRRAEPPAVAEPDGEADETQKVIRLEERRRPREGALSSSEEAAFRAIGAKLGVQSEAESPGALRFEEPASPAEPPARPEAPEAEAKAESSPAKAEDAPVGRTSVPDEIEPALAALSEKLAKAEAEADRRLAARRQSGKAEPAPIAPSALPGPDADLSPSASLPDAPASVSVEDAASEAGETETTALQATAASPLEVEPAEGLEEPIVFVPAAEEASAVTGSRDGETLAPEIEPTALEDEDDVREPPLDIAVFERLFAGLPLAVLVQVMEHTVYTNAEFGLLTGHADAAAVEAAGGLDALVLDRQGEGTLALLRADGEVVDVHGHMQRIAEGGRSALLMSFSPVPDETAVAGPALDDLRQEVEELQAVLDTATDGVVLLDMAGSIRAMNGSAHALFGLGADEAFGRHVSTLFAPESQKATADYLDMLRDDGIGGILNDGREVIGRVAQGGFIPLFITIGRLTGERGWCVVIRDIAHWKRIEEDLVNARRQAEAASLHKSRFLANISHELRTPLNAIIGFADVMSSECFGPIGNERYLEYLGDIKRSGHHVLDLVNDLLDISKIEAGKIDLSFEAVSLNEVISEAVSLMQPQANRERVIVRSNLPSSVPPVVADRRTMRQIALNLLANAIKFTPAGGQIIASTTYSAEGEVLLRFRDSGIGMTEREIELALTPFQQVHAPSANRGEGTGLGLPLTKAMVEANRASFSIQSTPGEGTLVEIVFPSPRVLAD